MPRAAAAFLALVLAGACAAERADDAAPAAVPAALSAAAALDEALAGEHRPEEERARDRFRNPKETLLFFGIEPAMTVVEIWPGGGWYANILAPFLARGGGVYYAATFEPGNDRAREALAAFEAKFLGDPALYGDVRMSRLAPGQEIAPAESADLVLTFRNVHNWMANGAAEGNFRAFYAALKPGGVLGVVEHRADEDFPAEREASSGYVKESTVIRLATEAGFELDARSEINANPADTKDHPFGVWTLPPVRRSSSVRGVEDPDFDRAVYDAIGESDRMTLRFRKPLAADGALLE